MREGLDDRHLCTLEVAHCFSDGEFRTWANDLADVLDLSLLVSILLKSGKSVLLHLNHDDTGREQLTMTTQGKEAS